MQKWSRGVFKIISIILLSVGVYSFIGHYQSQNEIYEPQDFSIIINNGAEELSSEIDQLVNAARLFKNEEISIEELQQQLKNTRNSFKKNEAALTFYYPEHIKAYINGAPLLHLDPFPIDQKSKSDYYTMSPEAYRVSLPLDELDTGHFRGKEKVVEPKGLQVLDELIFAEEAFEEKDYILQLAQHLQAYFAPIKTAVNQRIYFYDYEIAEAARLELIRIFSLGVTGFDTPGSLNALEEAKYSLIGIQTLIKPILHRLSKEKKKEIDKLFQKSDRYLEKNNDFENFDRLTFLTKYIDQLYEKLGNAQQELHIKSTALVYGETPSWNAASSSIFSKDFLNPYYYSLLNENDDSEALRSLGEKLFFDEKLSNSGRMSCASCHKPELAFTDGKEKSLANVNGKTVLRNSPSLINAVFADRYFYDLRAQDLEEQAEHVIENHLEFNTSFEEIIHKLSQSESYQNLFNVNFKEQESITRYNISKALSSYVLSLRSFDSEFDRYVRGESKTIAKDVKQGFNLFMGKANCATCHFPPTFSGLVPPLYQENESEVLGVLEQPNSYKIDQDLGRFKNQVFGEAQDIYKNSFKTTSVRNVEITAPYFHNGAYQTLEQVINFYNNGGAAGIGLSYELPQQTLPKDSLNLTIKEQAAMVSFLKSLTAVEIN